MLGFVVVIYLFVYFSDRSQYIALTGLEVGHAGLELAAVTKPLPPCMRGLEVWARFLKFIDNTDTENHTFQLIYAPWRMTQIYFHRIKIFY